MPFISTRGGAPVSAPQAIVFGIAGSILAWIFQDKIKGAAAFIHLRLNHLLNIGDWIRVPKYNVDGEVTRVTLTTVTVSTSELPETLKIGGKGAAALTGHPATLTVKGSFEAGSELWLTNNTATLSGTFGTVAMGALDGETSDESVTLTFACGSGVTVTGGITGAKTDSTSTVLFTGVGALSLAGAIDGGTASVRTLAFTQYAGTISLDAAPVTNFDTLSLSGDAVLVFTGGAAASGVTEYAFDLTKRSAGFASSAMASFNELVRQYQSVYQGLRRP